MNEISISKLVTNHASLPIQPKPAASLLRRPVWVEKETIYITIFVLIVVLIITFFFTRRPIQRNSYL